MVVAEALLFLQVHLLPKLHQEVEQAVVSQEALAHQAGADVLHRVQLQEEVVKPLMEIQEDLKEMVIHRLITPVAEEEATVVLDLTPITQTQVQEDQAQLTQLQDLL